MGRNCAPRAQQMPQTYSPKDYWSGVADSGATDATGYAPVLHPDAPAWFNSLVDRLQERAWRRGITWASPPCGARVLDVGCGTGRWLRRYSKFELNAFGVDATPGMLRRAQELGTKCPVVAAPAQRLPFKNDAFDLVSAVTVVQHVPADAQPGVLREMARVLRSGGHLMLLELTRGFGPHVFPRAPGDWIQQVTAAGLSLVNYSGQEFLLFDRALVKSVQAMRGVAGASAGAMTPGQSPSANASSPSRKIYWATRHAACKLSEWIEPMAQHICPVEWATHVLMVFRK
jgi:SAM-dependent methyltransferase